MKNPEKITRLSWLLNDEHKWQGVFFGLFHYSIVEREKYWSYNDDVEFFIACLIKQLMI
jgi:hypothetical protein